MEYDVLFFKTSPPSLVQKREEKKIVQIDSRIFHCRWQWFSGLILNFANELLSIFFLMLELSEQASHQRQERRTLKSNNKTTLIQSKREKVQKIFLFDILFRTFHVEWQHIFF